MSHFSSEHFLVVGATSEIGAAIARALIRDGARVTLSGRSETKLLSLQSMLGEHAYVAVCDLENEADRGKLLTRAALNGGKLSGMVYVAGFHKLMPIGVGYIDSLRNHLLINVEAPLDLMRAFVSKTVSDDSQQRSVTFIASVAHRLGEPALSAYSASKAAIISAARGLAVELAKKNIRVNTVSPGWVIGDSADRVSSMLASSNLEKIGSSYPLGFGRPSDVAEAVAYLASPAARWVTGVDLPIDGGRSCV